MARGSKQDAGRAAVGAVEAAAVAGEGSSAAGDEGVAGDVRVSVRVGVRKAYKMYVGGAFVRSESGRCTQVPEHAGMTGENRENVPRASRKDGRDAVKSAHAAWSGWSARTAFNRGQILYRLAEMLDARQSELSSSLERSGLSAQMARREVEATVDRAIAYAGWTDKYQSLFASLNPVAGPHFDFTVPESVGVVVIAAPARPALLGLAGAILPVIAAGNTCIVLASEQDPRTAIVFAEALATSDLPGGVVNILTGRVAEVLPHLARHQEVAALDLHGLDAALRKSVEEDAAGSVKRVHARAIAEESWFDAVATESPRWIERFVELKTIWHPAGQ
ncbi:aldehyde dehydrogenase family protein [Chondromyces crocatus]|uniref:Aldehyde dehydrogenase n=1 Tax=Chondromyces crocatus TaxID=52 RepID=A0A0K1EDC6_CHOCO|nr:aldehyde dehydrogenase family protein [Chondromyces crocatus]AKT38880.1 aldehyde dehydrogenase [Chondromyces crocatus]